MQPMVGLCNSTDIIEAGLNNNILSNILAYFEVLKMLKIFAACCVLLSFESLLAAPVALLAAPTKLTLSWIDNSNNEDSFLVERKIGAGGTFVEIAVLAANTVTYGDFSVSPSVLYCYRVRARNQHGNSDYSNEACRAALAVYNLDVAKAGDGTGTMTSSPAGISCGADCSEPYSEQTQITLTAQPAAGSVFAGWSGGGCSGTGSCIVTMNSDTVVTANFSLVLHTLTVTKAGAGAGAVNSTPNGISCGADCSEAYTAGTQVTLVATPAAGAIFLGWSGSSCSGAGSCVVTMSAARSVTATFGLDATTLLVSKTGTGSGVVSSSQAGISCGADCSESYPRGTAVTLTAASTVNSVFVGWTGACSGTGSCALSMSADSSVQAMFDRIQYPVSVTRVGTGVGTVTSSPSGISCGDACSASFASGEIVSLTAAPAAGSTFFGWTGACAIAGSSPSCQVAVTGALSVGAEFRPGGTNFMDDFNRPDATVIGNGWVEVIGDLLIRNNELQGGPLRGLKMAVVPSSIGNDLTVSADFTTGNLSGAPQFGIVLRYQDPRNYYLLYRTTGGSSFLRISRVANNVEKILKSKSLANPAKNVFYRLSATVVGSTLTLGLNGMDQISIADPTFITGAAGIAVRGPKNTPVDRIQRIDNFSITPPPTMSFVQARFLAQAAADAMNREMNEATSVHLATTTTDESVWQLGIQRDFQLIQTVGDLSESLRSIFGKSSSENSDRDSAVRDLQEALAGALGSKFLIYWSVGSENRVMAVVDSLSQQVFYFEKDIERHFINE